eukprot:CAMPEP_0201496900 /NCGR_PEP_ID=MMETSP0151_2-20130828/62445_1 /ASSEMBLY_ACC=CAM_ASM_000257 /TAXON_ID=200890 /ORGANISM="Paramoeba atlantica, Strain 621/1 / CCAP 1560/9" /LENGTH=186 /DNA_ID=CAMNT_0047887071 /DNA_START=201 /DNA_END=761 /DNA_ORIENTATION=-
MPRLTQRPPEWKDEKLAFQKRIQEEKLKLKGLKPIQTVTEVIDDLFESEGVYKRPRLTKADKENNTRSINRKMENRLYFIVKKDKWEFPTLEWNSGETLRQTAERSNELHFPEFSIYVLSNSPDAHHDSPKNEKIQRTFFYRCYHVEGKPVLGEGVKDFAWVTKKELKDFLEPEVYESLERMLVDW